MPAACLQTYPYLQKDMKKSRNKEIGELFDAGRRRGADARWPPWQCALPPYQCMGLPAAAAACRLLQGWASITPACCAPTAT